MAQKEDSPGLDYALPLVLDASSPMTQVGIPGKTHWRAMKKAGEQAMESLFRCCAELFEEINQNLKEVDAVFYCEGPGSTLGLRIAAAFTRSIQSGCIQVYILGSESKTLHGSADPLHIMP